VTPAKFSSNLGDETTRTEKRSGREAVFLTKYGQSWAKKDRDNPITKETRKLLDLLKIGGRRNFYALRHTFQTMGDEAKDPVATRFIMGHADNSMSGAYRESVSDERLIAVSE